MTVMLKIGAITLALGVVFHAADSKAAISLHYSDSNAVNYCQAFTPGVSNTIRNRVIGLENVGTTGVAVACNFTTEHNTNDASDQHIEELIQVFYNGSANPVTITCTLLTGTTLGFSSGDSYSSTKTLNLAAQTAYYLVFTGNDDPQQKPTLSNSNVGVNCILPPHVLMTDVEIFWKAEDGIGT